MIFLNRKIVQEVLDNNKEKNNTIKNLIFAFLIGGLICLMGEVVYTFCLKVFKMSENTAKFIMYSDLIVSASIITGFGYYDKIGKVAGSGSIIPITGFANSITSSATESKPEGVFCGIFMNIFKLAGSVIASGIVSGIIVGLIKYLVNLL